MGRKQLFNLLLAHTWPFRRGLSHLLIEHLLNILLCPSVLTCCESTDIAIRSSYKYITILVEGQTPNRARKWKILKDSSFTPNFKNPIFTCWYVSSELKCFNRENECRMAKQCLNWFELSTPQFEFFIIRAGDDHTWAFDIRDFSNNIIMGKLYSLNLRSCSPVPKIKSFILRPTDYLIGSMIIKYCDCVFVLTIFANNLLSGKVPDDCLIVPWASDYMWVVDEINCWNSTVVG